MNSVSPKEGLGVDISPKMIEIAKMKYPQLSFEVSEAEQLELKQKYDYVIMSDILEHLIDVWEVLKTLKRVIRPDSQVIISFINPLWEPLLILGEKLRMKMPESPHNRLYSGDIVNLLELNDFEIKESGYRLFIPKKIPWFSDFLNKYVPKFPLIKNLCFVQYLVAIPKKEDRRKKSFSCSVIIPCHNEEESIAECIKRVPKMGRFTEIIVVDDGSTDKTKEVVHAMLSRYNNLKLISYFPNKRKGFAVRKGFDKAEGDVLMILDADMAVPPEELCRFFEVMEKNKSDAVNGTRMVYPMEEGAMTPVRHFGNKIFALIFTWLMGRRVTDTLCGTKAILKRDYRRIEMGRCPWGDFDILIGITKLNLKMKEIPIHYKRRKKGKSKMRIFKDGSVFLRMCWYGIKELKLKRRK